MKPRHPVIGMDLGTTHSVAAYVANTGHVTYVPNPEGEVLTPSCVCVRQDDEVVVGAAAAAERERLPDRVCEAFKRHMGGTKWSWRVDQRIFTPQALCALVLARLAADAERIVGPIEGAVISVPAYFGDRQRSATLEAAEIAGINVLQLVNEPTAAALAHAFESYLSAGGDGSDLTKAAIAATAPGVSVICDLGGGTFDVTVIRVNGNAFDILATGGTRLGGRDFDDEIISAIQRHLFEKDGPDPHHDPRARARMRTAAQGAKHALSVKGEVDVPMPYEGITPLRLTRARFETDASALIDRVRGIIEETLSDAGLEWPRVNDLLLVGGASRMPMLRRMTADLSGLTPNVRLQPDLAIAHGAAVYGAILQLQAEEDRATDTGPLDLKPIEGNRTRRRQEAAAVPPSTFDPAFAAAARSVTLHDVTSKSLGVVVRSPRRRRKVNAILIPRNAPLPATHSEVFATREPNQTRVCVPIVEGDDRDPERCIELGRCVIDPLPQKLPKGSPVRVTFSYDTSGCIHVRAEDLTHHAAAETTLQRLPTPDATKLNDLAEAVAEFKTKS